MNGTNSIFTSLIVFMVVFLSYVFMQIFVSAPRGPRENVEAKKLPFLFRSLYRLLAMCPAALGRQIAALQPERAEKLRNQLIVANIRLAPEMVLVAETLLGILGLLIPALVLLAAAPRAGFAVFAALICGFVGFIFPSMTVASEADKRQNEIMKNLPFAIDLIGSAMRAGLDFTAAIRYYVSTEQKTNPLAIEFGVMLRQLELGKTRVEALEDMAGRIQTDEFRSFTAAVAHGTEVGASIVDTMRIQAEEMRRARFNRAERKAARAPSLMILPIALFIMPAVFIVIGAPVYLKIQASGLGAIMK